MWTSFRGCSSYHSLTTSLFSPHSARLPLVDGSLEAKKSKEFAALLERSYLLSCHWLSFLPSVYVSRPLWSLLITSASHLPTHFWRLCPLPLSPFHSFFLCPAFLTTSLFLRSLFFIASANHWEHSLLVNGPTAIHFWLFFLTF